MSEQISIDEAVEAALNPVEFKDDVIRRTEERLKANLDKTMAEFKNDLDLFFAIKDAIVKLPDIEVGPASEEKQGKISMGLPGICCKYTAKQDGFECQGVLRLAHPKGSQRESYIYIDGVILSDDSHRYETCMSTVYFYMSRTIDDVPQFINEFRTQLYRVFFDHYLRNREDR